MNVVYTFQSRQIAEIHIMGVLQTIDHIEIKIKMPNPSHYSQASSKAPSSPWKIWMFFVTSKARESQNLKHLCIKASNLLKSKTVCQTKQIWISSKHVIFTLNNIRHQLIQNISLSKNSYCDFETLKDPWLFQTK